MVGYVKSYGGRPDPKPGKKLSDCVIRALCELTGIDWYEEHVVNLQWATAKLRFREFGRSVYNGLTAGGRKTG